jgi:hypothetical protein
LTSTCFTKRSTFRKPLLTDPLLSDPNQKYLKNREHGVRWHTLIIWITNKCWWIIDLGNNKSYGYQCNFICQDCTEAFTNYDQKHLHEIMTHTQTLLLWLHLKDCADLILIFIKSVTKSVSLSTEMSSLTKIIISHKYNTHVKYRIWTWVN